MRQFENGPLDPDALAELEAIDATLAGLSVDPIHAELAELALLLAAERELPAERFATELDASAARHFASAGSSPAPAGAGGHRRRWLRRPSLPALGAGLSAAIPALTAALVLATGTLSGGSPARAAPARAAKDRRVRCRAAPRTRPMPG